MSKSPREQLYSLPVKRNIIEGVCTGCAGKDSSKKDDEVILCDGLNCGREYHLSCVDPPLSEVPQGCFYCKDCDPIGTTKYLEEYLDLIEERRSQFPCSRDYVISRLAELVNVKDYNDFEDSWKNHKKMDYVNPKPLHSADAENIWKEFKQNDFDNVVHMYNLVMDDSCMRAPTSPPYDDEHRLTPDFFIGKIMKLFCPFDRQYHTGRIINWRSALPAGTDKKKSSKLFFGNGLTASKEFLIRFSGGVNSRKKTIHKWIIFQEHRCAVSACLVMGKGLSKSEGVSGYRPGQLMIRSCIESIPDRSDEILKNQQDYGVVTFFDSKCNSFVNLKDNCVSFQSLYFHQRFNTQMTGSDRKYITKELATQMTAAEVEMREEERIKRWTSKLHEEKKNRKYECPLQDEYGNELLLEETKNAMPQASKDSNGLPITKLCPTIQIGLDKQWIISRLRGDKLNLSLEGISSMTVSRLQAEDKLSTISEMNTRFESRKKQRTEESPI